MDRKDESEIKTFKKINIKKGGDFSSGGELNKRYSQLRNAIKHSTTREESGEEEYETFRRFYEPKIIKFTIAVDDVKKELQEAKKEFDEKIEETIKETKIELSDKIDDSKLKTIETLGIFVALFTFVSVNVQIFTQVTYLKSAMWFTLLLMGALGFFALIVHIIIKEEDKYFNLEYGKFKLYISKKILFLILFSSFICFALYAVDDEKLNIIKENKESIKIENQGSSVEIKDNNIPIEVQQLKNDGQ